MSKENIKNFIDSIINKNDSQSKVDFHLHMKDWFKNNGLGSFNPTEVEVEVEDKESKTSEEESTDTK